MRTLRLLAFTAVVLPFAFSAVAATEIPLAEFRSIELSNGGHVTVRHGAVQRVSLVEGDLRYTQVRVGSGQRLIIDNAGKGRPRGYRMQVEIVTPHVSRAAVSNGGTLQIVGAFPAQESIEAAVEQGGRIDIRAIAADNVRASVYSGGGIYTTARRTLDANVESGGAIKYWGDASVSKSIRDGGAVSKGSARDAEKPLSEFGPDSIAPIPPIPPVPPMPPAPPHPPHSN